jgi:DNA-directed RNA polymerase specialized sigma subunit
MKELLNKYEKYISYMANKLAFRIDDVEDLRQEGRIGLFRASKTVQNSNNVNAYLKGAIYGAMMHYNRDKASTIRTPRSTKTKKQEMVIIRSTSEDDFLLNEFAYNANLDNKAEHARVLSIIKNSEYLDATTKSKIIDYFSDMYTTVELMAMYNDNNALVSKVKRKLKILLRKHHENLILIEKRRQLEKLYRQDKTNFRDCS